MFITDSFDTFKLMLNCEIACIVIFLRVYEMIVKPMYDQVKLITINYV